MSHVGATNLSWTNIIWNKKIILNKLSWKIIWIKPYFELTSTKGRCESGPCTYKGGWGWPYKAETVRCSIDSASEKARSENVLLMAKYNLSPHFRIIDGLYLKWMVGMFREINFFSWFVLHDLWYWCKIQVCIENKKTQELTVALKLLRSHISHIYWHLKNYL